ncbi:class II fructose-1,6-bisphosphate aldolase [Tissierella pigra]|uniref:Class II fructose-1,6-bisphosphate aldolase n=1 Tax=Tissierella pigra TaxID=2607614 RepID=A0A6N7XDR5_9FIRM|nr:class II fructose-1,6-bisphosphate aldolase [Tissierella pigra]MBU5427867.1 class II fructose-1,6-bisphosphate aldolase [Tissierella pigra]MSU00191.1 class II fructose-1,6-bisphosphate aldolase [Tissierella pigra]
MLVTGKELLLDAQKKGYAVGAFNINNMEIIQAIIEAAEETNSPVILQASQGGIKYAGIEYISALGKLAARNAKVPVALHLDHGTDFDQVMLCIRHGFSSVMIDGSRFPLEENILYTKKVIEVAKAVGVSVEAELGKIGGTEDHITVDEKDATFTDPQEALRFVNETDVDFLAIAVGTAHGVYKGEPKLDFDRIKTIRETISVPLVLHGSSGVSEEALKKAISLGISKINIDTDLRIAFAEGVKNFIKDNPANIDPRKILTPAKEQMKAKIKEKMEIFGSVNKA